MRTPPRPLHLLLFGETFADNRVHRRFDKSRGYPLASTIAFTVVDQAAFIASDVGPKFADPSYELAHVRIGGVQALGIEEQVVDFIAGAISIAMPEVPLDPCNILPSIPVPSWLLWFCCPDDQDGYSGTAGPSTQDHAHTGEKLNCNYRFGLTSRKQEWGRPRPPPGTAP